jgi:hypothetical protein
MGAVHGFRILTVDSFEYRKGGNSAPHAALDSHLRERPSRIIDALGADGIAFEFPARHTSQIGR